MDVDTIARNIHRRGFVAGLIAVAFPASATAFPPQCAAQGEPCSLTVRCCSGTCVALKTNPNAGVCGTSSGGSSGGGDSDDLVTCRELVSRYDRTGDRTINCDDFRCRSDAQAFLKRYPHDPCGLDGDNDGRACQKHDYSATCPQERRQRVPARRRRKRNRARRRNRS